MGLNINIFIMCLGTIAFILSPIPTTSAANEKVKAAYWSQDTIPSENIDSTLFTHLFCAFAKLDSSTNTISIPDDSFSKFSSSVKTKNPSVKTLLSIGGGGGGTITQDFSSMTTSSSSRKAFIDSTISVARSNSFDGLDIDYEIPNSPSDMSNLALLFSEWRAATEAEATSTNRDRLLLTAAVRYTNTDYSSDPYPAQSIVANLDWINIMAYDLTAPATWGDPNLTGPTAALYDTNGVSGSDGINAWIQGGVPASKLVLGIPFYGWAWKLTDSSNHGFGASAAGPAITGDGAVNYRQVVDFVTSNEGAVKVFDSSRKANYCYDGDTWISYDDVESVAAKLKYVAQNGLLGYFAWQISGDDDAFTLSKLERSRKRTHRELRLLRFPFQHYQLLEPVLDGHARPKGNRVRPIEREPDRPKKSAQKNESGP